MANLADSQKLSWVLPGQPFGSGSDGAYSSATIPTLTKDSCSGTSGNAILTTTGSTFANGDVLLLHQTRGTSAGVWEVAKVLSGGGSTSLTLTKNKVNTYTDSGASQAQAIKIPQYTDCTVESGTWTVPAWDGNVGGILPLAVSGTLTVTGTISGVGGNGASGATSGGGATSTGYRGGNVRWGSSGYANSGEGTSGASAAQQTANGTGGGGGYNDSGRAGGGGGANGTDGTNGTCGIGGGTGGAKGVAAGSADLVTCNLGGGGGGGSQDYTTGGVGGGGGGGAIVMVFAKNIASINAITLTGGNGGSYSSDDYNASGGAGSGGSCLVVCATGTLGTTKIIAAGGTGGGGYSSGGNGGVGRIAIHHSGTVTGTTTPTFTDVSDPTLVESLGGSFLLNFI